MNSFDINRFGRALRWMISVNFRSLLMWTLGLTLGVAMGEMMVRAMMHATTPQEMNHSTDVLAGFFVIYVIIGVAVSVCNLFVELDKKPRRQAFLMLPATNLEKFLAATVFATVSGFVMMHLSFIVGDTLRVAFRALFYGESWNSFVVSEFVKMMTFDGIGVHHTLGYRLMGLVFLVCGLTWVHSFYTLGGTLFRKYAFVISSIVLVAGITAFVWFKRHHGGSMFYTYYTADVMEEGVGAMTYVLTAFFAVFSVVNYWLSFRIFKGFELITNKWMNYDFYK
ncbi:hypothetical protein SAMN05216462_1586 [Xylanibacter ruminicola]|uniref:Uncharacterized protein n=1 Tax=Xylanibacter ruminicola TaxID=839 RepID=A0A1H4BSS0_XYLRU|nr:hypothetical protein [Xylanibacter ruminicola]SEA50892.1 hypothetical protein SAMN05216462_1586 [Xylanibacter ruminicola]